MEDLSLLDPCSYSRPDIVIVTNINIFLKVNFDERKFDGYADLTVETVHLGATELFLDVKDLNIKSIHEIETKTELKFKQSEPREGFGCRLSILLPQNDSNIYKVRIHYGTNPKATGLQWLTPEQTAGKCYPYVFSQFQPIHARSFLPCQDTPGVKTKYEATISAPKHLTVLMSAIHSETKEFPECKQYHFKQEIPVPTYLIAIVIGALESKKIGPRSTIWSEKELIQSAAKEFEDTEKFIQTAEIICGPYVWGKYDILVLPPSFPLGGMEHSCLTFVTPTVLAGDKSLVNVIAHEVAHSWSGNLVTMANFEHYWLNEGFTIFIERKIIGRIEGEEVRDFMSIGGTQELKETIELLGVTNPLTKLVVNIRGVNPDNTFISLVPYEKGQTFLRYLEDVVGGPSNFEPFLKEYFAVFKYKSITTDDFKNLFETFFANNESIKEIDWKLWLHTTGMPSIIPKYNTGLLRSVEVLKKQWIAWSEDEEIPFSYNDLQPIQKMQLLQDIFEDEPQPIAKLEKIEKAYNLAKSTNCQIKCYWFRIGIKARWKFILEPTLVWLNEIGRVRFLKPLYHDLYLWDYAREKTVRNFEDYKNKLMYVTAYIICKELQLVND